MLDELLTSIIRRPYVFLFLAAYLFLAHRLWGWRRTCLWLTSGYGIAWASEFSSITNGFPYGEYHYLYENMPGELMVMGVPFFDSLSYPFLIFAGYAMALKMKKRDIFQQLLLGAFFTMLLDMIIDPIAHLGDRWFLGKIYYYADPGWYFDVPWSNFAGWFLVAFLVILFNTTMWRLFPTLSTKKEHINWLPVVFYFSIALFNIVVTFSIGAWKLGICSSLLIISTALVAFRKFRKLNLKERHL